MIQKSLYLAVLASLTACGNVANVRQTIESEVPAAKRKFDEPRPRLEPASRVVERTGAYLPVKKTSLNTVSSAWLRSKRTEFFNAPMPTPISQFIASVASKGVNIISDLPLDTYTYTGTIQSTDVETALRVVLNSSGLDYEVDEVRQIVTIKSLPTKTWTLNIGKRRSTFATGQVSSSGSTNNTGGGNTGGGSGAQSSSTSGSANNSGGSNTNSGSPQGQGTGSNTGSGGNNNNSASGNTGQSGTTSDDDFWSELKFELDKRMKVPMQRKRPNTRQAAGVFPTQIPGMQFPGGPLAPAATQDQSSGTDGNEKSNGSDLYEMTKVGDYSLNPVTGAIRVQAPRWLLAELDDYIRQIQEMYDAEITYEGQLVFISQTDDNSEGIDVQSFATWASGRYGAVLSNSSLGGVSVNFAQGNIPSVSAVNQTIGGPLLGIFSAKDGLSAFNNYMKGQRNFTSKERVKVLTSSGVPGQMSTFEPVPYQEVQQSASVGNVGAAQQATNYVMKYQTFGTTMRVNPRYDLGTGKIRALVEVTSNIYAGDKEFSQIFSIGATTQNITQKLPLGKEMIISSETQMRDGDLIVLGGKEVNSMQTIENGLPTTGAPLGGLAGTKQSNVTRGTYYFLLQVKVSKR